MFAYISSAPHLLLFALDSIQRRGVQFASMLKSWAVTSPPLRTKELVFKNEGEKKIETDDQLLHFASTFWSWASWSLPATEERTRLKPETRDSFGAFGYLKWRAVSSPPSIANAHLFSRTKERTRLESMTRDSIVRISVMGWFKHQKTERDSNQRQGVQWVHSVSN